MGHRDSMQCRWTSIATVVTTAAQSVIREAYAGTHLHVTTRYARSVHQSGRLHKRPVS